MKIKNLCSRIYYKTKFPAIRLRSGCYVGRGSSFEGANVVGKNTVFAGSVGYASCIAEDCNFTANIGRYCAIGSRVYTLQFTHPTKDFVSIHPAFYSMLKQSGFSYVKKQKFKEIIFSDERSKVAVTIGSDCWIGSDVTIRGGVTIGHGAIVAAGALVLHDVEPYTIVGGVPAKVIRKRFTDNDIEYLLNLEWWNKPEKWIKERAEYFESLDKLKKFIDKNG